MYHVLSGQEAALSNEERFLLRNTETDMRLLEFWQWNQSDLLSNALRRTLAEFIVAKALTANNKMRIEWNAFDLVTPTGIKVEVKSAAYVQSWQQVKNSAISFRIAPAKGWEASTNKYAVETRRNADVYVFCLLNEQDRSAINPLNLSQWEFFVLSTKQINQEKENQKTVSLNRLLKMKPVRTEFLGLAKAAREVMM
ncbi:hypothetical protein RRU94_18670 [Domibacillus sp. DTU_2020_1001157_1_SI_ALB_TIR_016]|uniref:hypothetical protein n=1 Tax=Domibacillus sp. DTU_2020_1001157_1_SI_ALB_TIR_016 TaxID=3077789 RepID=UPI0028EB9DAA|nr:hypothetical protein [Domibacillus sp. DTU_2020_1001157_1_SI_ALB_TIR_016]WNS79552.1 hypothetical protein RRU94_18670 [Domibacillus sp. DTU_2020_1001157_1_SI_ALB_TIR_016]